jgi:hypothetical protein
LGEDTIGIKKYNRSRFLVWTVSVIDYCLEFGACLQFGFYHQVTCTLKLTPET